MIKLTLCMFLYLIVTALFFMDGGYYFRRRPFKYGIMFLLWPFGGLTFALICLGFISDDYDIEQNYKECF